MKTSSIYNKLENKKGIIVFSDPAGAKACLSIIEQLDKKRVRIFSDRDYGFYQDFNADVTIADSSSTSDSFSEFLPEFVLTGTSIPEKIELGFIREAKQRKIHSISFIDHWTNIKERFESGNELVLPDEIWVIDEKMKEMAIQAGMETSTIQLVGNPYFDYLKNWQSQISRNDLLEQLGFHESTKYIVYAPQPLRTFDLHLKYGFSELEGLIHLENSINDLGIKDVRIVVSGHPNQIDRVFLDHISNQKSNAVYTKEYNLNDLICHANLVAGYFSNSLLEAAVMGKEIVRILIDLKNSNHDRLNGQLARHIARSKDELKAVLTTL